MMKVLFVFGTRPEAIKLIPVIKKMERSPFVFDWRVCISSQHKEMLWQVLKFFDIVPHYDLDLMKRSQTLFDITATGLKKLEKVFEEYRPDTVIVQGDTTSTFIGALAAFYRKVKVAYVEAGLRSFDRDAPFPEEINRVMVSHLADIFFAPTEQAKINLAREGITENVFVVGNTVIDALFLALSSIENDSQVREKIEGYFKKAMPGVFRGAANGPRLILVTAHRRENFGGPFEEICGALSDIAKADRNTHIVYPVHLNPNVREPVFRNLKNIPNIHLVNPLAYPYWVWLMNKAYCILTDSGGIQEEAPVLGKPVLVMRDVTERIEGMNGGTAKLVGTSRESIVRETLKLIEDPASYNSMSRPANLYGDGRSAERIIRILSGKACVPEDETVQVAGNHEF